jgi:NAD(P)-dependent dehydrogenase (short-subunit alcohol dehydrogenase family)
MTRTAVIAGVGPGLGASLARRFAAEGCDVGLLARTASFVEGLASEIGTEYPGDAVAAPADITDREAVAEAFGTVREALGPVDVLVNHASGATWDGADIDPADFRQSLEVGPVGSLHCTQEALADMRDGDRGVEGGEDEHEGTRGTVIFTGATSAVRGRDGALGFSAAKFSVRGMAESLARELGPEGIHVAHVVIDGGIATPAALEAGGDPEELLDPDAIADSYWHLVEQDRSSWTLELDVRPHVEEF